LGCALASANVGERKKKGFDTIMMDEISRAATALCCGVSRNQGPIVRVRAAAPSPTLQIASCDKH